MPELPEVENIVFHLKKVLLGRKIADVLDLSRGQLVGNIKACLGQRVVDVRRRGKMILFELGNGYFLLVHLKLTGQLIWSKEDIVDKTTRVVLRLDRGFLFFNDLRRFGYVKVLSPQQFKKEFERLGIEPLSEAFTFERFLSLLSSSSKPIKNFLLDQEKIVGVGNIYASEILFEAGILPTKPTSRLNKTEAKRLYQATVKILKKAIRLGGSSIASYQKPDRSLGGYQKQFLVYQREDQRCRRCSSVIKKIKLGGRSTFYCPSCQK